MSPFLLFHVTLSLVGIFSGFVVLGGLLAERRLDGWTLIFLVTTVLTSATGFFLPAKHIMPSHIVGILSLVILAVTIYARYARGMRGAWRWIYVTTAMMALYLNVFVGIVQAFLKIPAFKALAPTQTEPPFKIAQFLVLLMFVALTTVAMKRRIEK